MANGGSARADVGVNATACSGDLFHPRVASLDAPDVRSCVDVVFVGCVRVGAGEWSPASPTRWLS